MFNIFSDAIAYLHPKHQTFPGIFNPHQGPRQPWHDVHARVTGEAAIDVLQNFKERWKLEAPKEVEYNSCV